MGGYIRLDKDLEDDPRVADLGEILARSHFGLVGDKKSFSSEQLAVLGLACDAVIGGLYRLWRYGDTYLGRHDRLKHASQGLARIEEVTALPLSLLNVFPIEWLKVHADGSIELPGYSAKNALINRDHRRESGRKRTAKYRERKRQHAQNGDASRGITDEASQRHKRVTTGTGTGTGPGTEPSETGSGSGTDSPGSLATAPDGARSPGEEARPRPTLTLSQMQAMAASLAERGRDRTQIASVLEPYGATPEQIAEWLAPESVA